MGVASYLTCSQSAQTEVRRSRNATWSVSPIRIRYSPCASVLTCQPDGKTSFVVTDLSPNTSHTTQSTCICSIARLFPLIAFLALSQSACNLIYSFLFSCCGLSFRLLWLFLRNFVLVWLVAGRQLYSERHHVTWQCDIRSGSATFPSRYGYHSSPTNRHQPFDPILSWLLMPHLLLRNLKKSNSRAN